MGTGERMDMSEKCPECEADELAKLKRQRDALLAALNAGIVATDHIAIAGSLDNLREGQMYVVKWRPVAEAAIAAVEGEK